MVPNKNIIHPWNTAFQIFAFFDCYMHDYMPYILHDAINEKKKCLFK
jgi:hypothetical protein